MMSGAFTEKIEFLRRQFASCGDTEVLYKRIIDLGRAAPPLDPIYKQERYRVSGCQSVMHLFSEVLDGCIQFKAGSEALISNGLAHLLTTTYSGEALELVLKTPPAFLEELGIPAALSPSRANGLASLYVRMKQDALAALIDQTRAPR